MARSAQSSVNTSGVLETAIPCSLHLHKSTCNQCAPAELVHLLQSRRSDLDLAHRFNGESPWRCHSCPAKRTRLHLAGFSLVFACYSSLMILLTMCIYQRPEEQHKYEHLKVNKGELFLFSSLAFSCFCDFVQFELLCDIYTEDQNHLVEMCMRL